MISLTVTNEISKRHRQQSVRQMALVAQLPVHRRRLAVLPRQSPVVKQRHRRCCFGALGAVEM